MGFWDIVSGALNNEKDRFSRKLDRKYDEMDRKIDEYERRGGDASKVNAARDKMARNRENLDNFRNHQF